MLKKGFYRKPFPGSPSCSNIGTAEGVEGTRSIVGMRECKFILSQTQQRIF